MVSGDRWFEPSEYVLLTGAGLTKNFGGYLATEMWAAVLNQQEVQKDDSLRQGLLRNLNYEKFYDYAQESETYNRDQKASLTEAFRKAYQELDDILTGLESLTDAAYAFAVCRGFIGRFSGEGRKRGFFFTLNQDLFIERFYVNEPALIKIPALNHPQWFGHLQRAKLDEVYEIRLPTEDSLEKVRQSFWAKGTGQFVYLKLHGSFGWKSQDGSNAMVIGQGKEGRIEKEPLLRWYRSLFEEVLNYRRNRKLVVVGYGFGDKHINEVIANAIEDSGLKLFIISPQPPGNFQQELTGVHGFNIEPKHRGEHLWGGLYQYWPARVTEFVYHNQTQLSPRGRAFFERLESA